MPEGRVYVQLLAERAHFSPREVLAKILTPNDDAGRHGVLIPTEAYSFFPDLPIPDPAENSTAVFLGHDVIAGETKELGWKYYQRYPERRVTRLNPVLNVTTHGRRLAIFVRAKDASGAVVYMVDARVEGIDADFLHVLAMFFGVEVPTNPGAFVQFPVAAPPFHKDAVLLELLDLYDAVHERGWIDTMRTGDTGIGYTFETLIGIKENNDSHADFKGIEVKTKLIRDLRPTAGKINLFQMGPAWTKKQKGIERLRAWGRINEAGVLALFSQVTPVPNNLGLRLVVPPPPASIELQRDSEHLGSWLRQQLGERLARKHSRAVFVKGERRSQGDRLQYRYNEVIYCEQPDIERFLSMVDARRLVFEFTMSEKSPGKVKNHGYPWRLVDQRDLDQLFLLQVKLRG